MNVSRTNPSTLKITDMRFADIDGAPKRCGRQVLSCVTAAKVVHVGTGREFVCEKTVDGATVNLPADFKADANADVFKMVR